MIPGDGRGPVDQERTGHGHESAHTNDINVAAKLIGRKGLASPWPHRTRIPLRVLAPSLELDNSIPGWR